MARATRLIVLALVSATAPVVGAWAAVFASSAASVSVSHPARPAASPVAHPPHYPPPQGVASRCSGIGVDWYSRGWNMATTETAKDAAVVAGWPLRCLYAYEYRNDSRRGPTPPGGRFAVGIPLGDPPYSEGMLRMLPVRPLWGGFVADAGLVAAALGLFLFRRELASLRRRTQGTCSHCRHALLRSQATCPECGRHRSAA